mmetsp:Transcript_37768/g.89667  ORF Transcript_37768/g.89667 Transcript_37768/m.89667 type:complete len:243 (+) Transcript_37768:138-866(+)
MPRVGVPCRGATSKTPGPPTSRGPALPGRSRRCTPRPRGHLREVAAPHVRAQALARQLALPGRRSQLPGAAAPAGWRSPLPTVAPSLLGFAAAGNRRSIPCMPLVSRLACFCRSMPNRTVARQIPQSNQTMAVCLDALPTNDSETRTTLAAAIAEPKVAAAPMPLRSLSVRSLQLRSPLRSAAPCHSAHGRLRRSDPGQAAPKQGSGQRRRCGGGSGEARARALLQPAHVHRAPAMDLPGHL